MSLAPPGLHCLGGASYFLIVILVIFIAMPAYNIFFFGALFFLIGVFLASLNLKFWILIITLLIAGIFLFLRFFKKAKYLFWLTGLLFFVLVGSLYYVGDDLRFKNFRVPFDEKLSFSGVIADQPVFKSNYQEFVLKLNKPSRGKILVKLPLYPRFDYGDELKLKGLIKKPFPEGYERYLAKERVAGVLFLPEAELIGKNKDSKIKGALYALRGKIVVSFQKVLPSQEAAFLSGLTLGVRSEFSDEFKKAMSLSGTTHLVALSGYNITILAWAVMGIFGTLFKRRAAFILTIIFIIGFVLMAGASSSVVRAAIMGILVLLAREVGRIYDFRNAIIFAALAMVLENPKVLVFDVGFQLSFLALLGIIYLRPVIQKISKLKNEPGFLSWRDNLLTTASAQFAVAPLLIINFGVFSPTSLLANVIILETVPVAMALGFLVAFASFLSYHFSLIFSWLAFILLRFEILAIQFFAKFSIPISTNFSWSFAALYYILLIVLMFYVQRKNIHKA